MIREGVHRASQTVIPAILVVLFMALCAVRPAASQDSVLFVDELLPPFSWGEVGKPPRGGMALEIMEELNKRIGLDARIVLMPWSRALKMVRHGKADGLPFLLATDERRFYLKFTGPVLESGDAVLFNYKEMPDFSWSGFESLEGLTVGMIRGYAYDEQLLVSVREHAGRIEYSEHSEANIRKLHAGRVDVVIENVIVARAVLLDQPGWRQDISIHDELLTHFKWHMGISRKSPLVQRIDEINAALAEMRRDGTLEKIKMSNW
jgi:polar amino acid transport system substrate-binding protein